MHKYARFFGFLKNFFSISFSTILSNSDVSCTHFSWCVMLCVVINVTQIFLLVVSYIWNWIHITGKTKFLSTHFNHSVSSQKFLRRGQADTQRWECYHFISAFHFSWCSFFFFFNIIHLSISVLNFICGSFSTSKFFGIKGYNFVFLHPWLESLRVMIVCGSDLIQSFSIPGFWIPEQVLIWRAI